MVIVQCPFLHNVQKLGWRETRNGVRQSDNGVDVTQKILQPNRTVVYRHTEYVTPGINILVYLIGANMTSLETGLF